MAVGIGMRTIWITLRAINYTQRVFTTIIGDLKKLEAAEKKVAEAGIRLLKVGTAFIMTGMMMAAVGTMMAQSLFAMALESKKNWMEVHTLKKGMDELKNSLADTMFDILKATGALNLLNTILSTISKNKVLQYLVLGFMTFAAILMVVGGGLMLAYGALNAYIGIQALLPLVVAKSTLSLTLFGHTVNITIASVIKLGVAMAAAFGAFAILMQIGQWIGPVAGAIIAAIVAITAAYWALFVAESAATLGIATAIGAAAAAVAMGVQAAHGFQMGTRALPHTGLFLGHKGEVVYNPATGRPTQIGNEIEGRREGIRSAEYNIDIHIDNVHTKANFEDLDRKIKRSIAEAMRDKE